MYITMTLIYIGKMRKSQRLGDTLGTVTSQNEASAARAGRRGGRGAGPRAFPGLPAAELAAVVLEQLRGILRAPTMVADGRSQGGHLTRPWTRRSHGGRSVIAVARQPCARGVRTAGRGAQMSGRFELRPAHRAPGQGLAFQESRQAGRIGRVGLLVLLQLIKGCG